MELTEFHVSFLLGLERIHFYYHERGENEWAAGGHTSANEITRLGHDPRSLRVQADAVAAAFVEAWPVPGSTARDDGVPAGSLPR